MTRRPYARDLLRRLPGRFPGTIVLAAITLGMFVAEHLLGGGTDLRTHLRLGAMRADRLVEHWELWRLVMPMFIHFGAIHLVLNGLALIQLGPVVEALWGTRRLVVFYVVSGICASLVSAAFNPEGTAAAVGASGAIMGLAGLLLGASMFGEESSKAFLVGLLGQRLLRAVVLTLAIGIGLWFVLPIVDNWAHVGGLVCGLLLAVAHPDPMADRAHSGVQPTLGFLMAAAVVVASFASSALWGERALATIEIDTARQLSVRASQNPGRVTAVQSLLQMLEWYDDAHAHEEGVERFERAVAKFDQPILLQILASGLFEAADRGRDRDRPLEVVLERWVELSPEQPEALNALAWHLVTRSDASRRDPARAEVLSRESLARVPAEGIGSGCRSNAELPQAMRAQFLDTLAESLYQQQRYTEALEAQTESVALARELDLGDVISEMEERLHKIEAADARG